MFCQFLAGEWCVYVCKCVFFHALTFVNDSQCDAELQDERGEVQDGEKLLGVNATILFYRSSAFAKYAPRMAFALPLQ